MFGFKSWTDFTTAASATIKSAAEKTQVGVLDAYDKSKTAAVAVSKNVTKFVEEQKLQYDNLEHQTDLDNRKKLKHNQIMNSGKPPWYIDPLLPNYQNEKQIEAELRLNILKLCDDESNFLYQAPSSTNVFNFKLQSALPIAKCILNIDPILPKIRFKLVPKQLSEQQFWKNYFYRVNLIRENLGVTKLDLSQIPTLTNTTPTSASGSGSGSASASTAVDDADNSDANQKIDKSKAKKIVDKQSGNDKKVIKDDKKVAVDLDIDAKSIAIGNTDDKSNVDVDVDVNLTQTQQQITDLNNDMDISDDNDDFLDDDDDIDISNLSDAEKAKMKKELGINNDTQLQKNDNNDDDNTDDDIDVDDVDDLLASVNTDGIDAISDGELENMVNGT